MRIRDNALLLLLLLWRQSCLGLVQQCRVSGLVVESERAQTSLEEDEHQQKKKIPNDAAEHGRVVRLSRLVETDDMDPLEGVRHVRRLHLLVDLRESTSLSILFRRTSTHHPPSTD